MFSEAALVAPKITGKKFSGDFARSIKNVEPDGQQTMQCRGRAPIQQATLPPLPPN